jgi:hypothetical protein
MTLAVGTKLLALPALILLIGFIIFAERKNIRTISLSLLTLILTGLVLFGPFFIIDKDSFMFNVMGFHLGMGATIGKVEDISSINMLDRMIGEIFSSKSSGLVFDILRTFLAISSFMFIGLVLLLRKAKEFVSYIKFYLLYGIVFFVSIVNFLKILIFVHHETPIIPIASILAGYGFTEVYSRLKRNYFRYGMLVATTALIVIAVVIQTSFSDVNLTSNNMPIQNVEEMAAYIRNYTPPDGKLLTFSTFTALQANREVLPGFETSIFSYYSTWSDDSATKYHVVNKNLLEQYINSKSASAILLTSFDTYYYVDADMLLGIEENYFLAKVMGQYGQRLETAYLYLPKDLQDSVDTEKFDISVDNPKVSHGDIVHWSAKRLTPNAEYVATVRQPSVAWVVNTGTADNNGEASGSFQIASNMSLGPITLRIEDTSDNSRLGEKTLVIRAVLTVQKSQISYDDTQTWSVEGLPPDAEYVLTLGSPQSALVFVLGKGSADSKGEASGSFLIGQNLPSGDNVLSIALTGSSYKESVTFKIG